MPSRYLAAGTWALLGSSLALAGCGAGGQAWVDEAAIPAGRSDAGELERVTELSAETTSDPVDTGVSGWDRKSVITLGERVEVPRDAEGALDPAAAPRTVSYVTNNYYPPAYGYGYGYGYGLWPGSGWVPGRPDHGPVPPPESSAPTTPRVGGNWPAPPSYGPPVMTHTAPADPWR